MAAVGPAAEVAGTGLLVGLAIAAEEVACCNATSSAELAAVYPTSGGTYVYGREQLAPFWGYLAGWGFVVGKTASCAAMALTVGPHAAPTWQRPIAVAASCGGRPSYVDRPWAQVDGRHLGCLCIGCLGMSPAAPAQPDHIRGHLDMLALAVLAERPAHGYAVLEMLKERSDGVLDLPEGSLYPALHRLEAAGLLASAWDTSTGRKRRVYKITKRGRSVLSAEQTEWHRFVDAVQAVLRGGAPWPSTV